MKNLFKGRKLLGVNAIMLFLNLRYLYTVTYWIVSYGLPCRKESGIWAAYTRDLKKWRMDHPDVVETESWRPAEKIEYRKVKQVHAHFHLNWSRFFWQKTYVDYDY